MVRMFTDWDWVLVRRRWLGSDQVLLFFFPLITTHYGLKVPAYLDISISSRRVRFLPIQVSLPVPKARYPDPRPGAFRILLCPASQSLPGLSS